MSLGWGQTYMNLIVGQSWPVLHLVLLLTVDFPKMQYMMVILPMVIAAVGIGLSIIGIYMVKTEEGASQRNLLKALAKGIDGSSVFVAVASFVLVWVILVLPSGGETGNLLEEAGLPHGGSLFGVFGRLIVGLVSGWIIGKWTEYSTSEEYAPTKRIADQAVTGPATVIISGVAEGFYSVWVPIVVVGISIMAAFGLATGGNFQDANLFAMGLYGVAIAAVGMLSTLGITLATDAYGPIADNAGGNAEMSKQESYVRERTDALDSLGNTTAATGKGFAIGSAALTALALMAAYVEEVRVGFDRWAEGIESLEVTTDTKEATLTVIRKGVLAYSGPGTPMKENDKKEMVPRNEAVLMFATSNKAEDTDIDTILKAKPGEKVVVDLERLLKEEKLAMNSKATMPDFIRYYNISIMNPSVLVGIFMGVMLAFVFCAMTMKAVGRAAGSMVEEVRRQFREIPGIMEGNAEPEYASCVAISTAAAQREMIIPALLGLIVPILVGLVLGVGGVMGMLAGGLTSGFAVAIMMANSGGAWDNAKKYIEAGAHGGKGTEAHKATVVGDTVGDPFKDTSGPSLNILIKLMSMVSVVFAGFIVKYALQLL